MRKPVTPKRWKQPAEIRVLTFDFGSKLLEGDSVSGMPVIDTAGLTLVAQALAGNVVTVRVSGGSDGETYRVSCLVDTAQGEKLELDVDLEVLDGAN